MNPTIVSKFPFGHVAFMFGVPNIIKIKNMLSTIPKDILGMKDIQQPFLLPILGL